MILQRFLKLKYKIYHFLNYWVLILENLLFDKLFPLIKSFYVSELCETLDMLRDQYQDMSWFLISFNTNTKTCLDIKFKLRPIPRLLLICDSFQDQYQDQSWFLFPFKTNTKSLVSQADNVNIDTNINTNGKNYFDFLCQKRSKPVW